MSAESVADQGRAAAALAAETARRIEAIKVSAAAAASAKAACDAAAAAARGRAG
ncbi:hypothetical protein [Streptomyces sp. NPDC058621]|uniref:hypothetical protein n=1 Tax=Streptomyces sp. NPDC058621 TaxID=3346561 RepID=UPI003666EEB8